MDKSKFDNLTYPIHKVPLSKKVFDEFPKLARIYSLWEDLKDYKVIPIDKLIRMIVYCYDLQSPLAKEKNINQRRIEALALCGVELDPKDKENKAWGVALGKDKAAAYAALIYIKNQDSLAWLEYCQILEVYHGVLGDLTDSDSGNKTVQELNKQKMANIADRQKLRKELDKLADEAFAGDMNIQNFITSFIDEEQRVLVSAEDFVYSKYPPSA